MTGGMVNMARGLGTALGVALVTLGLHAGAYLSRAEPGALAIGALAAAAIASARAGNPVRASRSAPGSTTVGGRGEREGQR